MTPKGEWLSFSGWDSKPEEIWFRDRIAALFDLDTPTPAQKRLLHMASLRLTLQDLPAAAYSGQEAELKALAEAEFGPPPV